MEHVRSRTWMVLPEIDSMELKFVPHFTSSSVESSSVESPPLNVPICPVDPKMEEALTVLPDVIDSRPIYEQLEALFDNLLRQRRDGLAIDAELQEWMGDPARKHPAFPEPSERKLGALMLALSREMPAELWTSDKESAGTVYLWLVEHPRALAVLAAFQAGHLVRQLNPFQPGAQTHPLLKPAPSSTQQQAVLDASKDPGQHPRAGQLGDYALKMGPESRVAYPGYCGYEYSRRPNDECRTTPSAERKQFCSGAASAVLQKGWEIIWAIVLGPNHLNWLLDHLSPSLTLAEARSKAEAVVEVALRISSSSSSSSKSFPIITSIVNSIIMSGGCSTTCSSDSSCTNLVLANRMACGFSAITSAAGVKGALAQVFFTHPEVPLTTNLTPSSSGSTRQERWEQATQRALSTRAVDVANCLHPHVTELINDPMRIEVCNLLGHIKVGQLGAVAQRFHSLFPSGQVPEDAVTVEMLLGVGGSIGGKKGGSATKASHGEQLGNCGNTSAANTAVCAVERMGLPTASLPPKVPNVEGQVVRRVAAQGQAVAAGASLTQVRAIPGQTVVHPNLDGEAFSAEKESSDQKESSM